MHVRPMTRLRPFTERPCVCCAQTYLLGAALVASMQLLHMRSLTVHERDAGATGHTTSPAAAAAVDAAVDVAVDAATQEQPLAHGSMVAPPPPILPPLPPLPPLSSSLGAPRGTGVPPLIHQSWRDSGFPKEMFNFRWQKQLMELNAGWQLVKWTDESSRQLIAREYPWRASSSATTAAPQQQRPNSISPKLASRTCRRLPVIWP